ncbi:MAG: response regulator [Burkholderiales bacterium]|nr:response regulator [Burkholderiales bacterium]
MASSHAPALPASNLARVLGGIAFAFGLAVLVLYTATGDRAGAGPLVPIESAEFLRDGLAPRTVSLPHTWALDGLPNAGRARYRIRFRLDAVPAVPWALTAARLPSRHALWVNGAWTHGTPLDGPARHRSTPVVTWADLPPSLLRAGLNEIELDAMFDLRAGLSPILIGSNEALRPAYLRAYTLAVTVPQALNVFCVGLALFMLSIWWRRRSERALGTFAGLLLLIAVRNVAYTGTGSATHTPAADLLFYLAQVLSAMLLARFALDWSGRDWAGFRRAVHVGAPLLAAVGLVASRFDAIQALRVVTYPLLIASLVPSLWLMVLGARREAGATRLALVFGVIQLCLAPVHDYFYLRGLSSVMDSYWTPYATPVAMLIFAWAVLDRFVGALDAVEGQAAELERRVAARTAELATANATKSRFLAAASHDLRQPVASIGLLADLLRDQPLPAPTHRVLDRLGDSVHALNALLNGLLDLSRFDAGVVPVRTTAVALRPLLQAVLGDEREAARRKGIELRLRTEALEVRSDPLLLEQILRNLVGNAVRYTERGGVLVSARRRGGQVLVQVWDTGVGIPIDRQSLVFEEFVQLDNQARDRARGVGLGLSLVSRAAALLGVPLTLRSQPGRGSCFAIALPLVGRKAPAPVAADAPPPDLRGLAVWLVEDDPELREAMRLRLAGWGASVSVFAGAAAADAAIDGEVGRPELLITDQRLPDGSGLAVARRLRARLPATPVLVVTGDTAPADLRTLRDSGLPVLHKPFAPQELLAAVRRLVASDGVKAAVPVSPPPPPPASAN